MSKVGGSMDSVVLGVSEQVPQDRRSGQMWEQINMISDPVNGLVRRRGSMWQDELGLGAGTLATFGAEAGNMREFTFVIDGVEYTLLYRKAASVQNKTKFMYLFNKVTGKFMPIVFENSTFVNTLISGGVSAITSVGRYVYIAGNTTIPTYTQVDNWSSTTNLQKMAAWVRGGAYSRTFSVTLTKTDGTQITASYKTMASSYPELLDTSGISFYKPDGTTPDPEYQKNINDAMNDYNSHVTQYIGIAAEDITGENIANKLVLALQADGVTCHVEDTTVCVDDPDYIDITADDGGDGTLMKAVGREVKSTQDMTLIHWVGKTVRVRPEGTTDKEAYYLVAYASDGKSTGWTDVIWREGAGVVTTPVNIFAEAVITGGTMYIAQNGAGLHALDGGTHPDYKASLVGDGVSSPVPNFFGKVITMLTVFQDRLLIGTGGTVNCSINGDYLNFFRQTVLEILDNDPIEMYSYGSEGDSLRSSVIYDRDLIIFGDLKQYGVSGKSVLSAKSPLISTVSAHADAAETDPQASGNFVFYGKSAESRTSMHQLQIGQLIDSPVSFEVSQQLGKYLLGKPVQLCPVTAPNIVFYRTAGQKSIFYAYQYLDSQDGGQRLYDSWSKWQYADTLGQISGISSYNGDLLIFTMRPDNAGNLFLVADLVDLTTDLSDYPYMDSMKKYASPMTGWHFSADQTQLDAAADDTSNYYMLGTPMEDAADFISQLPGVQTSLWVGAVCDAFVSPTNPFVRDQNGKANLSGRLTLTNIIPSVTNTGGMIGQVYSVNGEVTNLTFEGRLLGNSTNWIARQPLYTGQMAALGIGKEVRDCRYSFKSLDWLPLCVTSIEWTGQWFNRIRRVG